jgi:small conductance mechanosensitive channel
MEGITSYIRDHWVDLALRIGVSLLMLVVAVVLGAILGRWACRALLNRSHRAHTLARIARTAVSGAVTVVGAVMALDHLGVDVAALLAGAGILGLAVGFGAQSLVKDVITGFFLIYEGAIAEGDLAQVGEVTGVVERVGLRVSQVRTFNGQLFYIPNGQISVVGNWSREWVRAVVEVGLAYEHDVGKALAVLQRVGDDWARENEDLVLEAPEAQGVLGLNASDVGVRLVVKVKAPEHWASERALRRRVKDAFDAEGVEIPFPRHVVYHRQENGDALRLERQASSAAARAPS